MGTSVALLTTRVWVLYGGDGAGSTGTGLLYAGVGGYKGCSWFSVQLVWVQSARVWVMCGGAGSWASTTVVLSASTGSMIFSEDHVFTPTYTAITPSN